jgi:hypothetical protein
MNNLVKNKIFTLYTGLFTLGSHLRDNLRASRRLAKSVYVNYVPPFYDNGLGVNFLETITREVV